MPRRVLIVCHSQSGSTRRMADAVLAGASDPEAGAIDARLVDALTTTADDVLAADGIILGTPENFGYMSGALKYFFDRIFYPCEEQTAGLPYALFVRAGNDGSGAISSVERIVSGLRWQPIREPLLMRGEFDEARLAECRELGMLMSAGLEAGMF